MNKQAELTRWTPRRLLSLLMALIMTLSLLPTAAFAADNPSEWYLDNFKTTKDEPESQVIVASGSFAGDARYELRINIDPDKTYMPGDRVSVKAIAEFFNVDKVNQPLKISISDQAYTPSGTSSTLTVTYPFISNNESNIIVGKDGSISFNAGITYNVTVDDTTFADTKNVTVKINNLWTGYNVTYSKPDGASFIGSIPSDGKAKTVTVTNADTGDFEQEYTIPDNAKASRDGCTFEGWTVSITGLLSYDTQPGATLKGITGDVTLTALLPKNQTITFDEGDYNGSTGVPIKSQTSQGTKYTIPSTEPSLTNFKFNGWLRSDTNETCAAGQTITGITSPITLTAQWTPADGSTPVGSHKVTFLGGAANVYIPFASTTAYVKDGESYTIPTAEPTREGYEFKGWSDGKTTYQAGAPI